MAVTTITPTLNESFTLGMVEGDTLNTDTGSLTGVLLAGHDYALFYHAHIESRGLPSSAWNATARRRT